MKLIEQRFKDDLFPSTDGIMFSLEILICWNGQFDSRQALSATIDAKAAPDGCNENDHSHAASPQARVIKPEKLNELRCRCERFLQDATTDKC